MMVVLTEYCSIENHINENKFLKQWFQWQLLLFSSCSFLECPHMYNPKVSVYFSMLWSFCPTFHFQYFCFSKHHWRGDFLLLQSMNVFHGVSAFLSFCGSICSNFFIVWLLKDDSPC